MNDEQLALARSLEQASAAADLAVKKCRGYAWTGSTPGWERLSSSSQLAVISAGAAVSFLNALAEYEQCLEEVHARAAACKHMPPPTLAIPVLFPVPLLARKVDSPKLMDALRRLVSRVVLAMSKEFNDIVCATGQQIACLTEFRQLSLADLPLTDATITLGVRAYPKTLAARKAMTAAANWSAAR